MGEEDKRTAKEEQEREKRCVCDADQSLGDTLGGKERKKGGENTHRVGRPVKERAVIKRGMRRWRQGGETEKSGRYSQSHEACMHIAVLLFCVQSLWEYFFFHDLLPHFAWKMHAHIHPHKN